MDDPDFDWVLNQLAGQVREAYRLQRWVWHLDHEGRDTRWGASFSPRYDGGVDARGRTRPSAWARVVQFGLAHGVDLQEFVRAQFVTRGPYPVEPHRLAAPGSLDLYRRQQARVRADRTAQSLACQQRRMRAEVFKLEMCKHEYGWTDAAMHRIVLTNMLAELSALFRYCFAEAAGYDELAALWRDMALIEYLLNRRDLDRVWDRWIPDALRDTADRFLRSAAATGASPEEPEASQNQRALLLD